MPVRWVNREEWRGYFEWKVTKRNREGSKWDMKKWKGDSDVKNDGVRRWEHAMV